jgi:EAL and modified HD-GYP domain-containing signal transduction protein
VNLFDSIWRKHKPQEALIPVDSRQPSGHAEADAGDGWRFIARQAIFDKKRDVFGYELLARSGWENRFTGDSDTATRKMIFDGALYGFEGLTRGRRSFVNCTRESLVEGLVTLLPKTTVLEILETVTPDEQVIEACRKFKELGYQIALDDFRIGPAMEKLVELADYVKVDFRLSDKEERRAILAYLDGSKAQLVAEKIETEEEYKTAAEEGFDLFQGYFFCHPTVFSANRAPATGNNYLQLFSAVSQKDLSFVQLAELIKTEVTICYQLLRLVNSAAFGLPQAVESVQHALAIVGEAQFRKLVLNAIAVETCKKHPDELLVRVLHRARFFELMSPFTGENPQEQYLFGLVSLMGVMLDMPLPEVIKTLPLRDQVREALNGGHNSVATAMGLLECYEEGNWDICTQQCIALNITESKLTHIYEESTRWAEQAANPEPQRVE